MNSSDNHRVAFAEFELDRAHRRLYRDGEMVPLYAKAFDLLVFLIEHNGAVVRKSEILDNVWADQFVEEANLSVQISALRKALGETTNEPRFLVTVPGVGYKFVADVQKPDDDDDDEIVIEKHRIERFTVTADTDGFEGPPIKELPAGRARDRSWILGFAAVALIAALGTAGYFYYSSQKPRIASVAVLPFEYQDRDPSSEYLSEGLAESVIHSLSRSPDLRVMSRNSAFRFRGPEPDVRAIGRELNVDAILTGRIVTRGENLSIRAELISATDNSVVWGEQFTRKLEDVERLQSDIAESIAQRLRLRLADGGAAPTEGSKTVDPEAYRLTLLGRYYLNKLTDEGFRKGLDQFQKALELDPNYAPAHAGSAEAYNRLSGWNAVPPYEGFPKARAAAEKALELDDRLAEAHATLGMVKLSYDWDWAGSEKEFKRAIEINPNDADAHQQYSYHLASVGRFDESLAQMKHALELDPLTLEKHAGVGEILYLRRDYDSAIQQYRKAIEMESNSGFLHWAIGKAYLQKGMYDEAISEYRKSIPLSGDSPDEPASLAYALAVSGRRQEAHAILKDLEENYPKRYVSPSTLAIICAGLGDNDRAFDWLEKAYERRDLLLILLKVEPMFDPLRGDPRFADLARRVGHTL